MGRLFSCLVFVLLVSSLQKTANAQEITLPAGTLLNCTLDEPNLSSRSAQVGDPVICHASGGQQFGRAVFPRGAYLAGRLAAYKNPGHFFGKGWLKLEFDRLSLPDTVLPVPGKLVGVRGYRLDREGRILGHGHPRRDAIEWLTPPLWPWKVLSLPARGPRPTLKGETEVTLRLMDDVAVPLPAALSQPPALRPSASRPVQWMLWTPPAERLAKPLNGSSHITYAPPSIPAMEPDPGSASTTARAPSPVADSSSAAERQPARLTLIALKGETIYGVTDYWIEDGRLFYTFRSGAQGAFDFSEVDWHKTIQLNTERGITLTLRTGSR